MSPSATSEPLGTLPSSQRCEPGSINPPIAKWPTSAADGPVDAVAVTKDVIAAFNSHLGKKPSKQGAESIGSLFLEGSYWRDHLTLSWDLQTLKTAKRIAAFLEDNSSLTGIEVDDSTEFRAPKVAQFSPEGKCKGIISYLSITTKIGGGRGIVRLVEDSGKWKIWTLFTSLEELKGFEEPRGPRRPNGVEHGYHQGRKNWLDRRRDEENFNTSEPDVIIIGKSTTSSIRLIVKRKRLLTSFRRRPSWPLRPRPPENA